MRRAVISPVSTVVITKSCGQTQFCCYFIQYYCNCVVKSGHVSTINFTHLPHICLYSIHFYGTLSQLNSGKLSCGLLQSTGVVLLKDIPKLFFRHRLTFNAFSVKIISYHFNNVEVQAVGMPIHELYCFREFFLFWYAFTAF